jgi:hypothetical protein
MVCMLGCALVVTTAAVAQTAKSPTKGAAVKAAKDEKVCRHRFADGEIKTWVCKKDAKCCSWDDAKYVRCSTITGCLIGTAPTASGLSALPGSSGSAGGLRTRLGLAAALKVHLRRCSETPKAWARPCAVAIGARALIF